MTREIAVVKSFRSLVSFAAGLCKYKNGLFVHCCTLLFDIVIFFATRFFLCHPFSIFTHTHMYNHRDNISKLYLTIQFSHTFLCAFDNFVRGKTLRSPVAQNYFRFCQWKIVVRQMFYSSLFCLFIFPFFCSFSSFVWHKNMKFLL